MSDLLSGEYDAFKRLTDGIAEVVAGARQVAALRPDQAQQWLKMAEAWEVAREATFRLAGTGVRQ